MGRWHCLIASAIFVSACAREGVRSVEEPPDEEPEGAEVFSTPIDGGAAAKESGAGASATDAAGCRMEAEPNDDSPSMLLAGANCGTLPDLDVDSYVLHPRKRTRVSFNATGPSVAFEIGKPLDVQHVFHTGQGITIEASEEDEWLVRVSGEGPQSYMIVVTELR